MPGAAGGRAARGVVFAALLCCWARGAVAEAVGSKGYFGSCNERGYVEGSSAQDHLALLPRSAVSL